jgi:hypothetical protein
VGADDERDTQIWDGASWREGCRKSELDRIERIAAASDGSLWSTYAGAVSLGVDPADGRLCLFLGGQVGWAQTNFTGLTLVAAGSVNCVWGVEADGQIVDFTAHGPFVER